MNVRDCSIVLDSTFCGTRENSQSQDLLDDKGRDYTHGSTIWYPFLFLLICSGRRDAVFHLL